MQVLHAENKSHAIFDDPRLLGHAGLVPVMRLAGRAGLGRLAGEAVSVDDVCGANPQAKVTSLVAGMVAGADSIDAMGLLRHGAMDRVFSGVRAPSTLGSFLRAFHHGNVAQVRKVARQVLVALAGQAPLLSGAERLAFIDIDSCQRRVYGHAKQGAYFGHAKIGNRSVLVRGLNALATTISTPASAPVLAQTRLRDGNAASARGAASLLTETITTAREAGATGTIVVRGDSAYYAGPVLSACCDAGVRFSVTARMDPKIKKAIAAIDEDAWTPIKYPNAIFDEQAGRWVSEAEVAETTYTAFTSNKAHTVTARLIVRRVQEAGPGRRHGQHELFPAWRYHAVFTDSPFELIQAEAQHRGHAIIEQTFADAIDGPLAHLPSGHFPANHAWLALAGIAHNLTRAAGALASTFHAQARAATIRTQIIAVPAETALHGRGHITYHLPENWPCQQAWKNLFAHLHSPPAAPA